LLAQLMYYVKDIENFGTGIKKIYDACEAAGVKVEYEMRKFGLAVVFYRPDIALSDGKNGNSIGDNVGVEHSGQDTSRGQVTGQVTGQDTGQDTGQVTEQDRKIHAIISFCEHPRTRKEIQDYIGIASREHFTKKYLTPLLETGQLKPTVPDKPNSKNQKYVRGQKNG